MQYLLGNSVCIFQYGYEADEGTTFCPKVMKIGPWEAKTISTFGVYIKGHRT